VINIKVIATGNIKEEHLRVACNEYLKRLSALASVSICELKEAKVPDGATDKQIAAALSEEAVRIGAQIPPRSFVVALAIEGKTMSSEKFAAFIDKTAQTHSSIVFIIGSSHGLDESIKKRADASLSMSEMTFPHQLFRVMLLEQIYRAFSINKGTKYHK
jgi:23S rRNA (pseudouridine1915-N3)-methyltransferase